MLRIALPLTLVTLAVVGLFLAAPHAPAGDSPLTAETVEYKAGDVTCEGYLVFDPAVKGARPGVLVVHDWMGIGDFAKAKADALARLGYTAFAADIYGKGVRPKDGKEAGGQAGRFKGDRALLRARVTAAFEALVARKDLVDAARVGSIGFCFGGTTVLEARAQQREGGRTVSFHGGLESPTPADAKQITGTVLALRRGRPLRARGRGGRLPGGDARGEGGLAARPVRRRRPFLHEPRGRQRSEQGRRLPGHRRRAVVDRHEGVLRRGVRAEEVTSVEGPQAERGRGREAAPALQSARGARPALTAAARDRAPGLRDGLSGCPRAQQVNHAILPCPFRGARPRTRELGLREGVANAFMPPGNSTPRLW
jgi:dienelactone hydrolase